MDASKLRDFVEACKKDPSLLADPSLAFFRDYLQRSISHPLPHRYFFRFAPIILHSF